MLYPVFSSWVREFRFGANITPHSEMMCWRQDGREIFFVSDDNTLMAAEVEGREKNFDVKKVRPLFHANFAPEVFERLGTYDVAGDGSRFLINTNDQPAPPISLVLHWPADLNKESTH